MSYYTQKEPHQAKAIPGPVGRHVHTQEAPASVPRARLLGDRSKRMSNLKRYAGRVARHAVVKATWQPIREPAQSVPREVMEDFEAKKAGLMPLKLARDNRARPNQDKSNMDKQGYQTSVQDKEVHATKLSTAYNYGPQ